MYVTVKQVMNRFGDTIVIAKQFGTNFQPVGPTGVSKTEINNNEKGKSFINKTFPKN